MKRNNVTYNIAYESTTYVWYGVTLYSANVTLLMLRNIAPDPVCPYSVPTLLMLRNQPTMRRRRGDAELVQKPSLKRNNVLLQK
jgi:hypothetical protein